MNVYDVLRNSIDGFDVSNFRLTSGRRWLVMDQLYDYSWETVVYGQEPYKQVKELYRGKDEQEAISVLIEGCEIED
jgi:hypothetical protein